jgi:hypothetical protein
MFYVEIRGREQVIARFTSMPGRVHSALLRAITRLSMDLANYIKTQKLEGQVLRHITGTLQSSIKSDVTDSGSSIIGRAYSSGTSYAAAQEYGAQIPERRPVNSSALHFFVGGAEIFCKYARGFTLKEHSFMRSSLSDNKDNIISSMKDAVLEAAKK